MSGIAAFGRGLAGTLTDTVHKTFGQSVFSNGYLVPAVLGILGIFLVVLIIVTVIQLYQGHPAKQILGPIELFNPASVVLIDRDTTVKSMAATYTLSFYLKMDAVPDMRAGSTPLLTWAGVWNLGYSPSDERLIWTFGQITSGSSDIRPDTLHLPKVPLQKWMQVVLTFEGRSVDLYVNGQLSKSFILRNLPASARSSITIQKGNVIGKIAYIQLWSRRLTVPEVANNYTDTCDSQGRPYLGPELLKTLGALGSISIPNLFCPSGSCGGTEVVAKQSQIWEFAYA
jgi:hypothetical protein